MVVEKRASPAATAFMVRNIGNGVEVSIQRRNIVTEGYDPKGKDKIEVGPSETMRAGETPLEAALRAINEEWGIENSKQYVVKLHGEYDTPTVHPDVFLMDSPLPVMVNTEYDYPWICIPVVIQVSRDLKFCEDHSDGEAKEGRFLRAEELYDWLNQRPEDFFRLTHAGAVRLCHKIRTGQLEIPVAR